VLEQVVGVNERAARVSGQSASAHADLARGVVVRGEGEQAIEVFEGPDTPTLLLAGESPGSDRLLVGVRQLKAVQVAASLLPQAGVALARQRRGEQAAHAQELGVVVVARQQVVCLGVTLRARELLGAAGELGGVVGLLSGGGRLRAGVDAGRGIASAPGGGEGDTSGAVVGAVSAGEDAGLPAWAGAVGAEPRRIAQAAAPPRSRRHTAKAAGVRRVASSPSLEVWLSTQASSAWTRASVS
jgi:hypothetical protein